MGIVLLASPNGSLVIMDAIGDGHGDADVTDHDNDDGDDLALYAPETLPTVFTGCVRRTTHANTFRGLLLCQLCHPCEARIGWPFYISLSSWHATRR